MRRAAEIERQPHGFPVEVVSRKDAARRQICTAIDLVLGNGDAVSANVLTWSAAEILRGVGFHRNLGTFTSKLEDYIKEEYLKDWRFLLKDHYNYFKHADRDPERVVSDFTPEATTWALFGACNDYNIIYEVRTWSMLVYTLWFSCRHPDIMEGEGVRMVDALSAGLNYPEKKPLAKSVEAAFEILRIGRKSPSVLSGLGQHWLRTLKPE